MALLSMLNFIVWVVNLIKKSVVSLFQSPSVVTRDDDVKDMQHTNRLSESIHQVFIFMLM